MTQKAPPLSQAKAEAFSVSAFGFVCWLLGVITRFGLTGRGSRIKQALTFAERLVERILLVKAIAIHGAPPQRSRTRHPRFAPIGFRWVASNHRLFYRNAGIRARKATALTRIIALVEALTFPENAVRYFLKKLAKGLRASRIVMIAPPFDALTRDVRCFAIEAPDTS